MQEKRFDLTASQVDDVGLKIRRDTPDVVWGKGEFRNAIFETMVSTFDLPWDEGIGAPDFDDPMVRQLSAEFNEVIEDAERIEREDRIEGRCTTTGCGWSNTAEVKYDNSDRVIVECDLTGKCREHHLKTGDTNRHNSFELYRDDERVGGASVSSQVCIGYLEPLD